MKSGWIWSCLLAGGLAACASQSGKVAGGGEHVCFDAATVSRYAVQDRGTVNLRAGSDVYQIKLLGVCPDMPWSGGGVRLSTGGTATVCTGNDVNIAAQTARGPQECAAESMRRLTPDEVRALPPAELP